jgi:ribonuclease HI
MMWGDARKELSQGYRRTTNNRMELLAVIKALESINRTGMDVTICSDSSYVVDAISKGWLKNWIRINFKDKKNPDLWKRYAEISKAHNVKMVWVKGHASNPFNNRCDELATAAADGRDLLIDEGYEQSVT